MVDVTLLIVFDMDSYYNVYVNGELYHEDRTLDTTDLAWCLCTTCKNLGGIRSLEVIELELMNIHVADIPENLTTYASIEEFDENVGEEERLG